MFRPSRDSDRPAAWLGLRMSLFGAAALAGVVGMATQVRWIVYIGIGLAVMGLLVRFLPER